MKGKRPDVCMQAGCSWAHCCKQQAAKRWRKAEVLCS
jgi:hypothetical protein